MNQGNQDEIEPVEETETPDIVGLSIKEAKKILKEKELEIQIENETEELNQENTIVKEQTPKAGIKINKKSKVTVSY